MVRSNTHTTKTPTQGFCSITVFYHRATLQSASYRVDRCSYDTTGTTASVATVGASLIQAEASLEATTRGQRQLASPSSGSKHRDRPVPVCIEARGRRVPSPATSNIDRALAAGATRDDQCGVRGQGVNRRLKTTRRDCDPIKVRWPPGFTESVSIQPIRLDYAPGKMTWSRVVESWRMAGL